MTLDNKINWAIGLLDAEGYIGFNKNGNKKWVTVIKVSMKNTNARAIYKLKDIFKVGNIYKSKDGVITYKLTNKNKFLNHLKPILEKYPLQTCKYFEYLKLLEAINILNSNDNTDIKHNKLLLLKEEVKILKTNRYLKSPFLNLNPFWLAGFIEGDGSFQINKNLQLVFELGQAYNHVLMSEIKNYLKITSKLNIRKDNTYVTVRTAKKSNISNIISLCDKKLLGSKSFELKVWAYAHNTNLIKKKIRAKLLLDKLRKGDN